MVLKRADWASHRALAAVSVLLGSMACGSAPEEVALAPVGTGPTVVAVEPTPIDVAVPPGATASHDGTLVMAGSYPVELVPHASGEVYAYVVGDAPPESTELAVVVPVAGGVRTVDLEWDPVERRYGGRVRRVEIVPGPVDVVIVVGGRRWMGRSTTVVVRPAIVVAPVVVAPEPVVVVPVVVEHEGHRGRHRGWAHGRGHGHGHHVRFRH